LDKQGAQRVFERILVEVAHAKEVPLLERLKTSGHRESRTIYRHRWEPEEDEKDDETVSSSMKMNEKEVLTKGKSSVLECKAIDNPNNGKNPSNFEWILKRPQGNKRLPMDVQWHDKVLQGKVIKFLELTVAPLIAPKGYQPPSFHFWNTHCVGGTRYIANPMHYVQKGCRDGWHDWALVNLNGEAFEGIDNAGLGGEMNVIHMMAFVEIKGTSETVNKDYIQINGDGLYVVCHALEWPPTKRAHAQCRLINVGQKKCVDKYDKVSQSYMKEPVLMMLPASAIRGPIAGVPDMEEYKPNKTQDVCNHNIGHKYFFINPKTRWLRIMRDWCENPT
jgi:hypothetical protein